MNITPRPALTENELSKIILDAAFKVHTKTGPGMPDERGTGFDAKLQSFFASFAFLA